jgi:hypothetical protein
VTIRWWAFWFRASRGSQPRGGRVSQPDLTRLM